MRKSENWVLPAFAKGAIAKAGTANITAIMEHHVGKRRAVIQAGAHLGVWPASLADFFDTVVAFEPILDIWRCAVAAIQAPNVLVIPAALTNKVGVVSIAEVTSKPWSGSHSVNGKGGYLVPAVTIDHVAKSLGLCVDAIMLDVEAYEGVVLAGAQETLREFQPTVSVEAHPKLGGGTEADTLLLEHGYRCVASVGYDKVYTAR